MEDDALHELTAGYALDALEATEARAYEQHLAHCARCRHELAALSASAGALAFAAESAKPPAALRERILIAIRAERSNVVPLRGRFRADYGLRTLAVAASVAAIGLGVWNVVLQERLDRPDEALRSVLLHGATGSVLLGAGGQGTLVVADLVAAPPGKTYQAWVIEKGRAEPAGIFEAGAKTVVVHLGRPVPSGAIVAVTIEREGGSQQPTVRPLITSLEA